MTLSKRSVEMLIDLVEIKLSYMDISDREDARDLEVLERCRDELRALGHPLAALPERPERLPRPRAAA